MRRRYSYGYGSYRGRSGFRTFLKILIAFLLAVLILVVAAFFFLERYLVYDSSGAHLNLPFFKPGELTSSPSSPPVPTLVLVSPEPQPTASPSPTPAPPALLHAVALPRTALYDGTAAQQVATAGGNAALFDMKADDGTLGYISALETSKSIGSSASDPALNAAIQGICQGDLYTIARVSCFRDNLAPRQRNTLAIKTNSGYNWRDEREIRWMSPTNEDARNYAAGVCAELAALGFDEIVLDYSAYPTTGKLNYIKKGSAYDSSQFSAVVSDFYAQVREALSGYPDVKLSIITDAETLSSGSNALSGQTVADMLQSADRLWVPASEDSSLYAQQLSAQGMEDTASGLVLMSSQAGASSESWLLMESDAS